MRSLPPPGLSTMSPLPSGTSASAASPLADPPPAAGVEPPPVVVAPPVDEPLSEQAATRAPGATSATIRPHRTSRRDRVPVVGVFVGVVDSTAVKTGPPTVSREQRSGKPYASACRMVQRWLHR